MTPDSIYDLSRDVSWENYSVHLNKQPQRPAHGMLLPFDEVELLHALNVGLVIIEA